MVGLKRCNAPSSTPGSKSSASRDAAASAEDREAFEDKLSEQIQQMNVKGLSDGDIVVHRAPVCSFLTVPKEAVFRAFKLPTPSGWVVPENEAALKRRVAGKRPCLGMTRKLKPIAMKGAFKLGLRNDSANASDSDGGASDSDDDEPVVDELAIKYEKNPLILWQSEEDPNLNITVEPIIGKYLRDHQREGVQFLLECVCGLREFDGNGCILADDMGLGKTLQSITLLYTLLRQGMEPGKPVCQKVIVCTPTSLVRNWDKEIEKWLKGRVRTIALAESSRNDVIRLIKQFRSSKNYQVLVISYDTFRIHSKLFEGQGICDLLICDEAHRLKNDQTLTSKALDSLVCTRRILLSGTPMQNDLEEFYAMVQFCNPNVLGTVSQFRRNYQAPILIGREPDASDAEVEKSEACSKKLSAIVNQFILRRTNSLLSKHLPPKLTQVVVVKMSSMQEKVYNHFVSSKQVKDLVKDSNGVSAQALSSINALKKIANHPQLVYKRQSIYGTANMSAKQLADQEAAQAINSYFPAGFGTTSRRVGGRFGGGQQTAGPTMNDSNCKWSGKFLLIAKMLQVLRNETTDRIVLVSNYTQTLDVFASLCRENNYPFVKLDGSTSGKKRQALVDRLNDPHDDVFVFLLSSKAGGCGLNMIGANRLVLFDPDWNPATDKQAAARVWRDGQKKRTYVYRFVSAGTIEEKIFQRQLSKEGLQGVVDDDQSLESMLSTRDLKDLFRLQSGTISDTHDKFKCTRCDKEKVEEHTKNILEGDVLDVSLVVRPSQNSTSEDSNGPVPPPQKPARNPLGRRRTRFEMPKTSRPSEAVVDPATLPPPPVADAPQVGFPGEGDLNEWAHHLGSETCDDDILRRAGEGLVTFAFSQAIDGESLALVAAAKAEALAKESPKRSRTDDGTDLLPSNDDEDENVSKKTQNSCEKAGNERSETTSNDDVLSPQSGEESGTESEQHSESDFE